MFLCDSSATAIDATHFPVRDPHVQFQPESALRELNKALAGFLPLNLPEAEGHHANLWTGNWGAGCFNGHARLKAVLQWAAASAAGCQTLRYCTFGNDVLGAELAQVAQLSHRGATVGSLLTALVAGAALLVRPSVTVPLVSQALQLPVAALEAQQPPLAFDSILPWLLATHG